MAVGRHGRLHQQGLGISGPPLRFNCRGEAAVITLRRSALGDLAVVIEGEPLILLIGTTAEAEAVVPAAAVVAAAVVPAVQDRVAEEDPAAWESAAQAPGISAGAPGGGVSAIASGAAVWSGAPATAPGTKSGTATTKAPGTSMKGGASALRQEFRCRAVRRRQLPANHLAVRA